MTELLKYLPGFLALLVSALSFIFGRADKLREELSHLREELTDSKQEVAILKAQRVEDVKNYEKLDEKLDSILIFLRKAK